MAVLTDSTAFTQTDSLLDTIRNCRTITEFVAVYESEAFQLSLARLASWMAAKPDSTSVEDWAKQWAVGVATRETAALTLNRDRKACLQLLYSVCDSWRPKRPKDATVTARDIVEGLQERRISNILAHCLVMDRAQALYVMRLPGTSVAGMHWYAERHAEDAGWRKTLEGYEGRHTMNKRLLWLIEDLDGELGLSGGALNRWIRPEVAPN